MKNRIISLFIYLLPSLIYAQNNADDKYEILSLTDMFSLFKDSKNSVPQDYDEIYVPGYFYEPSFMYPSPLKKEFCCVAQWRIPNRNCKYLFLEDIFPQNKDSLKQASLELQKIKEKYEITERGTLSGSDGYLRPFLCYAKKETFRQGHVSVP